MLFLLSLLLVASFKQVFSRATSDSGDCSTFASSFDFDQYNATFLNSTYHDAGTVTVSTYTNNVAFCEVYTTINYEPGVSPSPRLVFTLWLPDAKSYRNRFMAVGDGGFAGLIDTTTVMFSLNAGLGFAVAGGDGGHDAYAQTNGTEGGYPGLFIPFMNDKVQTEAWIRNGISLFTPLAKDLTTEYYRREPSHMYYYGCSTGGGQEFALAQYHPELFDGLFAGSPGNLYDQLMLSFLWNAQAMQGDGYLPQETLAFITAAAVAECDELDGVKDGVISNLAACRFEIDSLTCGKHKHEGNGTTCLTNAQLVAAKKIYAGPRTSDTDELIYPGFAVGSEIQWYEMASGLANSYAIPLLQNLVYHNLSWDPSTFSWTSAEVKFINEQAGAYIDAIDPKLTAFQVRRGKLMSVQGLVDQFNSPFWPMNHYEQIKDAAVHAGKDVFDFFHLYLAPGAGHCGPAMYYPQTPTIWNAFQPLIDWVECGIKPKSIVASEPLDGSNRTRRLCSFPAMARYIGGDLDDWTSYVCE
ncbi:tannase and feruloyl esterase [Xylariaceae sp. FL0255]|nr:tannase and feruloyl esterase [Xylariaceae sp. FL0255]